MSDIWFWYKRSKRSDGATMAHKLRSKNAAFGAWVTYCGKLADPNTTSVVPEERLTAGNVRLCKRCRDA